MTPRCEEPLYAVFLEAGREAGYPLSDDLNGAEPEGFGAFQTNIDKRHPGLDRARLSSRRGGQTRNLVIETGAQARRLLLQGNRAVGAELCTRRGSGRRARPARSSWPAAPSTRRSC